MASSTKVRLNFAPNQNHRDVKPAVVEKLDFDVLLKTASNKLRIKAKRLFTAEGVEIHASNLSSFQFADNTKLIVSTGADYGGRAKEEKSTIKKKEDAVVGLSASSLSEAVPKSSENPEPSRNSNSDCAVRLIAKESLVEEEAVKQMNSTAQLPRMRLVVGLPDVHPGKGFPIGSASVSEDVFYPHLVGGDIGCGMSLFQTSIKDKKLKLDAWADALYGLEEAWEGPASAWLTARGGEPTDHDAHTLGTIGGGNHFAELQQVHEILNPEAWQQLGLDENQLFLLVHSGSRAYGESILRAHMDKFGPRGLLVDSEEGKDYLLHHDRALVWARANRALIAHRFMSCLTQQPISYKCTDALTDPTPDGSKRMLDVWHNFVSRKHFVAPPQNELEAPAPTASSSNEKQQVASVQENAHSAAQSSSAPTAPTPQTSSAGDAVNGQEFWLHRKGAAPADQGPVIIPGSRGHYSYLVLPSKDNQDLENAAYSLAHGAGRKWNRGKALSLGQANTKKAEALTTTELGSCVICENKDLLYEEVPAAYKEIESIIADLKTFKLISVIAIFKPLITYKTRATRHRTK